MELIIKRPEWLRGEGCAHSYLFRPRDHKMCCLGILAHQCGIEKPILTFISIPDADSQDAPGQLAFPYRSRGR